MKILVCLGFLSLLLTFEGWSQKTQSDRESAGFMGPVHVVREYRTTGKLSAAEISKLSENRAYKTLTYDRSGMLLEEDNLYGLHYTYTYGADGIRIKTAVGDKSPGSGDLLPPYVAERSRDKYAASGRKSETIVFLKHELSPWTRTTYEYDGPGRLRKIFHYWRDANHNLVLSRVINFAYHPNGDEKELLWRYEGTAAISRWSFANYKRDGKGNWVERTETGYQTYDPYQPKEQRATVYRFIDYY